MSFYQGKNASVNYSATFQPDDKYDLSFDSEIIDTSNFTSQGYQSNLDGVFSCAATSEGPYNGSAGLSQGQLITITFATGGGGPSFAIPLRLESFKISTATRNQVARANKSYKSSGVYSITL